MKKLIACVIIEFCLIYFGRDVFTSYPVNDHPWLQIMYVMIIFCNGFYILGLLNNVVGSPKIEKSKHIHKNVRYSSNIMTLTFKHVSEGLPDLGRSVMCVINDNGIVTARYCKASAMFGEAKPMFLHNGRNINDDVTFWAYVHKGMLPVVEKDEVIEA